MQVGLHSASGSKLDKCAVCKVNDGMAAIKYSRSLLKFSILSTLLVFPSTLGRTPFFACFKPYLQDQLNISDKPLSLTYTIGTFLASLCVMYIGHIFTQKLSIRKLFTGAYGLLMLCLIALIQVSFHHSSTCLTFLILGLTFTGMRLCCQGILPLCVRTWTALSYPQYVCAWIATLHTSVLIVGASLFIYLLAKVQATYQWDKIWWFEITCIGLIVFFIPKKFPSLTTTSTADQAHLRFKQYPRAFKLSLALVALYSLQATGLTFHLSDFVVESGLPVSAAYKLFLPMSIAYLILSPLCSFLITKIRGLAIYLLSITLIALSMSPLFLSTQFGSCGIIASYSVSMSLSRTLIYVLPPLTLSKEQIPSGCAILTVYQTLCSAFGPYLYSLLAFRGYLTSAQIFCGFNLLCFISLITQYRYLRPTQQ